MVNSCSISLHLIQRIVAHVKWSFRCNNIYCWKDSEFECVDHRRVCSIFYWLSFRVLYISSAVCGTLCLDGYYRGRPLVVLLFLLHPHDALIRASLPTYCALHYLFFTLPTFTDNSLTRRTKVGRSKYSQSFLPRIKLYPFQRISRSPHSLIFIASPPSPSGFTLHFVIFAPENSGAYLPDLSAELFSDPFNFFRSNKNRKIITMTDKRVISVIETYQQRLHEKPYVPSTTFGRTTLGANDVANKLFIAFVFSDPDVGVRFLKDVGLIQGSMGCCKYESQMFCCVDSNLTDGYRWWCRRITSIFQCCASASMRHGSWFRQSNRYFMEAMFLTYHTFRWVPAHTFQQEHGCNVSTYSVITLLHTSVPSPHTTRMACQFIRSALRATSA
jgi:hypothetical protein